MTLLSIKLKESMTKTLTIEKAVQMLDELAEQAFYFIRDDTDKPDLWINGRYYPLVSILEKALKDKV